MLIIDAIMSRRSIRDYKKDPLTEEQIQVILSAGMSGPTCVNSRDWQFIAVTDRELMNKMAEANGPAADPLKRAAFAVLICGDLERAFEKAKDYWIVDGAIAGENMVLAAWGLGIGSVWLGTWPQMNRVEAQKKLFSLPDSVVPHSIIAFGVPADSQSYKERSIWEDDRVHVNGW